LPNLRSSCEKDDSQLPATFFEKGNRVFENNFLGGGVAKGLKGHKGPKCDRKLLVLLPAYGDRTVDQMVQAARSGKQNIVEGSMASGTSKETEVKLTNVARASMEELKEDYRDFLRTRKLPIWNPEHAYAKRLRALNRTPGAGYEAFHKGIEHEDPEIAANVLLGLTTVACYLLQKQLECLEQAFLKEGGLRERMTRARLEAR
jgi:four helix bundle suffix protein